MDSYEIGKDIQSIKERLERLEAKQVGSNTVDSKIQEITKGFLPEPLEIKTDTRIFSAKTFPINFRKRAGDCESREGSITITSDGYYDGTVNFRCNCPNFNCARDFIDVRLELRDSRNATVVSVRAGNFGLGRADDTNIQFKGWDRIVAEAYSQIIFADPMFTCRG